MKIELSICEYSGEAVVCKVTMNGVQQERAEQAIAANPSPMFEVHGATNPVAETCIGGIACFTFIEDVLTMSIKLPNDLLEEVVAVNVWENKELHDRVIAQTWMLFIPHLKIFL